MHHRIRYAERYAPRHVQRAPRCALLLVALVICVAAPAAAEKKSRSVQTDARFVAFDPEAKTVTVKVTKPGKISDRAQRKQVRSGKEVVFDVVPEGSVLTRTTVAINGMKSELTDIDPGRRVYVYWVSDAEKPTGRFARKIDVIFTAEEFEERYGVQDVE